MRVCVSEELSTVRKELEKRGYETTDERSEYPCDAIICNLKNGGLSRLNMQSSIKTEGTLIIDIGNKNIEEIEYILNNRVYSNLF